MAVWWGIGERPSSGGLGSGKAGEAVQDPDELGPKRGKFKEAQDWSDLYLKGQSGQRLVGTA